jgi:prevent-host-death family protein
MATITIHKAKTQLSRLIARAEAGEEIIIARGKEPVVKLTPVAKGKEPLPPGIVKGKRVPGLLKGKVSLPDSFFFDPLPEEELKLWEGSDDDPVR